MNVNIISIIHTYLVIYNLLVINYIQINIERQKSIPNTVLRILVESIKNTVLNTFKKKYLTSTRNTTQVCVYFCLFRILFDTLFVQNT